MKTTGIALTVVAGVSAALKATNPPSVYKLPVHKITHILAGTNWHSAK
jgi:hypothetical protein